MKLYQSEAISYFAHLRDEGSGFQDLLPHPAGRLLDVGCGTGRGMQQAKQLGWQVTGVEPVVEFASQARRHGPVLEKIEDVEGTFDVVTIMAVLEHVHDPVRLLRAAATVARPGGLLIAEVPNGRRPEAWLLDGLLRLTGRPWTVRTAPMQTPFHLAEFSRQSVSVAVKRGGWQVRTVRARHGRVPYPLPRLARGALQAIQAVGTGLGYGLNLTVEAVRASNPS